MLHYNNTQPTYKMKIIAHTPYGVFEGIEEDYDEQKFETHAEGLERELPKTPIFVFNTAQGEIYMTSEMINKSLFILEK